MFPLNIFPYLLIFLSYLSSHFLTFFPVSSFFLFAPVALSRSPSLSSCVRNRRQTCWLKKPRSPRRRPSCWPRKLPRPRPRCSASKWLPYVAKKSGGSWSRRCWRQRCWPLRWLRNQKGGKERQKEGRITTVYAVINMIVIQLCLAISPKPKFSVFVFYLHTHTLTYMQKDLKIHFLLSF